MILVNPFLSLVSLALQVRQNVVSALSLALCQQPAFLLVPVAMVISVYEVLP